MRELDSYLNDHLAGSVGALELLDHWVKLCDGKPLAKFFAELREEIEADQKTLQELMRTLGTKEGRLDGQAPGWRRNLAGRASPSRVTKSADWISCSALETIALGITGKKLLWRALAAADDPGQAISISWNWNNAPRNKLCTSRP